MSRPATRLRLVRPVPAGPGRGPRFCDRAVRPAADAVPFDVEHAALARCGSAARANPTAALGGIDRVLRTPAAPVNGRHRRWFRRDAVERGERAPWVDLPAVPKAGRAARV